ncbi:MAG: tetratricopeptide repeat protein [Pyrinomonadaceae bacterium]
MFRILWCRLFFVFATTIVVACCLIPAAEAQTDEGFGDTGADPIKLFERGQNAHARGDFDKALDFYEQAIKIKPEFPEAEFQRGNALVSLNRLEEAEQAFERAISQKKGWSLPYSALGALLVRKERDRDAESLFRSALAIDPHDNVALRMLAELRLRAGDQKQALDFARDATKDKEAPASAWIVLAMAQRAAGDWAGAKATLDRVLSEDARDLAALMERADLYTEQKNYDAAIADLKTAETIKAQDKLILSRLAYVYQQAGKFDDAAKVAAAAGLKVQEQTAGDSKLRVIGAADEIEAANSSDAATARIGLQKLLEKNPGNAMLLARLGASYRADDPARSMEFYRRAAALEQNTAEYAVGYAAALVQVRRFSEAASILRQVIRAAPESYPAHANMATALYELKQYADAIPEYEWLVSRRPEVIVAYYFIATAHDYLGEYPEALSAYQKFVAGANTKTNDLEIEKVKLRLPLLERQIKLREGAKKKP